LSLQSENGRLTEGSLDHADLSGGRVQTGKRTPVVDYETGTNDVGPSVDGSGDKRDLEKGGKFVELCTGSLGVDETALECQQDSGMLVHKQDQPGRSASTVQEFRLFPLLLTLTPRRLPELRLALSYSSIDQIANIPGWSTRSNFPPTHSQLPSA
jgi:hypothetical protein